MSGLYISEGMRKIRNDQSIRDKMQDIPNIHKELYEELRKDVDKALANSGRDYITYLIERKVGKTSSLIRLADEFQCPIIVDNDRWGNCLRSEAKKMGIEVTTIGYRAIGNRLTGRKFDFILKEEGVEIEKVRDELIKHRLSWVSVVGIN